MASNRILHTLLIALTMLGSSARAASPVHELKVCADPNNLPFSNEQREGFENELAELLARDLHSELHYMWWPARPGFVRNTLAAHRCNVIMGVPAGFELAKTSRPYYRSSYVFISRAERKLQIRSWDDPALRALTVGVHAVGDDASGVPPAQLLARRGIVDNVRGYSIYGVYSDAEPLRPLIDAVQNKEIDVAIAWGPLAGYFAHKAKPALRVQPVPASDDPKTLPMTFDIALAVRREDSELLHALNGALDRREREIHALLERWSVPLVRATDRANPERQP